MLCPLHADPRAAWPQGATNLPHRPTRILGQPFGSRGREVRGSGRTGVGLRHHDGSVANAGPFDPPLRGEVRPRSRMVRTSTWGTSIPRLRRRVGRDDAEHPTQFCEKNLAASRFGRKLRAVGFPGRNMNARDVVQSVRRVKQSVAHCTASRILAECITPAKTSRSHLRPCRARCRVATREGRTG